MGIFTNYKFVIPDLLRHNDIQAVGVVSIVSLGLVCCRSFEILYRSRRKRLAAEVPDCAEVSSFSKRKYRGLTKATDVKMFIFGSNLLAEIESSVFRLHNDMYLAICPRSENGESKGNVNMYRILDAYLEGKISFKIPSEEITTTLKAFCLDEKSQLHQVINISTETVSQVFSMSAFLAALVYIDGLQFLQSCLNAEVPLRLHDSLEFFDGDHRFCINIIREAIRYGSREFQKYSEIIEKRTMVLLYTTRCRRSRDFRELILYLWAASPFKLLCTVGSIGFLFVSSKLMLAGHHLRRRIEEEAFSFSAHTPVRIDQSNNILESYAEYSMRTVRLTAARLSYFSQITAQKVLLLSLIGFEVLRFASNMIVDSASNEFLMASSSYHREKVKLELYKALSDTPLAFFDVHSFDDVEEMVFYINDLEGVDVHVKKYIIMSIKAVLNVIAKVGTISATVDARGTFLILLIVISIASPLEWILKSIAAIYRPVASETFGDIEEIENMGSAGSRVLLNGLQIIENVHTLRPFGADSQLMEWWVGHIEELQDRRDCVHENSPLKSVSNDRFALFATSSRVLNIIFNRVVGRAIRNTIYWTSPLLLSINSLIQMMLPLITSSMIQSSTGSSFVSPTLVSEVISSLEGLLKACTSGKDLWDLMLRNAHKAHVLNVLLSYSNKNVISPTKLIAPGLSINDLINGVRLGDVTPVMVDISDLSFAYPSRPDRLIFNKFEMRIPLLPGQIVAISGRSGCGKSTLLSLLMRLYDPKDISGERPPKMNMLCNLENTPAFISSQNCITSYVCQESRPRSNFPNVIVPFFEVDSRCARSFFTFVPQDHIIFPATVAQNIALVPQISFTDKEVLERVKAVAVAAKCDEFIQQLPEGYFTQVIAGSGGGGGAEKCVKVSGGQAQRICIARALFKSSSPIMIMDEPTSALDRGLMSELIDSLRGIISRPNRHCHVRTIVCMTHDEGLLQAADTIVPFPM